LQPGRAVEPCRCPGAIRRSRCACRASQRRHHPGGGDPSDRVAVASIRDIHVAGRVGRDPGRGDEPRRGAGAVAEPHYARRARQRRHYACGGDLADRAVATIRDIHVAGRIGRERRRAVEPCRCAGAIDISGPPGCPANKARLATGDDDGVPSPPPPQLASINATLAETSSKRTACAQELVKRSEGVMPFPCYP